MPRESSKKPASKGGNTAKKRPQAKSKTGKPKAKKEIKAKAAKKDKKAQGKDIKRLIRAAKQDTRRDKGKAIAKKTGPEKSKKGKAHKKGVERKPRKPIRPVQPLAKPAKLDEIQNPISKPDNISAGDAADKEKEESSAKEESIQEKDVHEGVQKNAQEKGADQKSVSENGLESLQDDPMAGTADIGIVHPRNVVTEMETSYLDYAMSVIVQRALPDARDGLKPVQRRILYTMFELGLSHNAKFRKCAKITGDTTGNYHPHGTTAVYDALARLAQDYSMRDPLIDGQGNFGSIDGDSPAAERYTEARMTELAEYLLTDIKKETVNFIDNYEATRQEPVVLPTRVPNLLLNGTVGIAVGMATSILPHNLGELVDACFYLVDNPDCEVSDLFEYIQGPDFPTGGVIYGLQDVHDGYLTGRGKAIVRARAKIEESGRRSGGFDIVITEIPYMVNKSSMIERIANLVKLKKIVGISDVRDESDRDGLRVVIELKKDAFPRKILNQLFQMTSLQSTLHMNMIALLDGIQPRLLNIKELLEQFLSHREKVIIRRSEHELRLAKERAHILEGLKIALDQIDAVIETIRASANREEAHNNLMKKFKLSYEQAEAILMMRLQALAGLERKQVEDEYKEKLVLIAKLEGILADRRKVLKIIKEELAQLKERFDTPRRTKIIKKALEGFSEEDLIPNQPMIVNLTRGNYIKRISPSTYRSQRRGGIGVAGMATKEEDIVDHVLITNTHNEIFFFTDKGRVFKLKAYEIAQGSRQSKGQPIVNLLQLAPDEKVTSLVDWPLGAKGGYLFMVTAKGIVKKTAVKEFANVRPSGLIAIRLMQGDVLHWVQMTNSSDSVLLVSNSGQSIRFQESDVRPMGRSTQGVIGMRLKEKGRIVGMLVFPNKLDGKALVLSENGYGKCTKPALFKVQHRGGSGIKISAVTEKTGKLVGTAMILGGEKEDLIVMSCKGIIIRISAKAIPVLGRATQGVRLMRMRAGDKVSSFTLYNEEEMAKLQAEDDELKGRGDLGKAGAMASTSIGTIGAASVSGGNQKKSRHNSAKSGRGGSAKPTK